MVLDSDLSKQVGDHSLTTEACTSLARGCVLWRSRSSLRLSALCWCICWFLSLQQLKSNLGTSIYFFITFHSGLFLLIFKSVHQHLSKWLSVMMTSSNGNIFRVTGHLSGEFTGPGEFPAKGQWRGALMFSLICFWINDWVNNREAGDLRRYRAHYDVTAMWCRYAHNAKQQSSNFIPNNI